MNRPVDQPPPTPTDGIAVWGLVMADMRQRDKVGRQRYGTPLQAHNGRDALVDAYQEALDLTVYLRQAIEERGCDATAPRVYISGPMTGYDEFNYPAFNAAAAAWRAAGWTVVNPAENHGGDTTLEYADYLRLDIAEILTVDAVAVLPGWEQSRGAKLETSIADVLGVPILDATVPADPDYGRPPA